MASTRFSLMEKSKDFTMLSGSVPTAAAADSTVGVGTSKWRSSPEILFSCMNSSKWEGSSIESVCMVVISLIAADIFDGIF